MTCSTLTSSEEETGDDEKMNDDATSDVCGTVNVIHYYYLFLLDLALQTNSAAVRMLDDVAVVDLLWRLDFHIPYLETDCFDLDLDVQSENERGGVNDAGV